MLRTVCGRGEHCVVATEHPDKAELIELAEKHLYYEVAMLRGVSAEHSRRRREQPGIEKLDRADPERIACMAFFEAALAYAQAEHTEFVITENSASGLPDIAGGTLMSPPVPG